jgi:beta-galactosidase
LHYEGAIRGDWRFGHSLTDVICPMYPSIAAITDYAKSGKQDRPLIMCEYSHAMGNSNGTLAEYWKAIETLPGLQGGFIWEFWDHGPDQKLADGTTRSAYGGDYGETKHDGNFCCDGMVFPDRTAKPAMHEFKAIAAPAVISSVKASSGQFTIFNKQFFTGIEDFDLLWSITRDGLNIDSGRVKLPAVGARKTGRFTIKSPHLLKADGKGERFITFTLLRKSSTAWAPTSAEIGWNQFSLPSKALSTMPVRFRFLTVPTLQSFHCGVHLLITIESVISQLSGSDMEFVNSHEQIAQSPRAQSNVRLSASGRQALALL